MQIIDANYFFTAAFSIEVVLQSIAKNFIIGPNGEPSRDLGPYHTDWLHHTHAAFYLSPAVTTLLLHVLSSS